MLALKAVLLSTAWLFGPLEMGTAELRLDAMYAQADLAQAASESQRQETQMSLGAYVGVTQDVWIGLTLPHHFVRHGYQGRLFFDRARLGAMTLQAAYQLDRASFISVVGSLDLGDDRTDFNGRFGELEDRFATIDPENTVGFQGGTIHLWQGWRFGLLGTIQTPLSDTALHLRGSAYALFEPGQGMFSVGPNISLDYVPDGHTLRVGLLERLGGHRGWSAELTFFTDLLTGFGDLSTGVTGALVWRG